MPRLRTLSQLLLFVIAALIVSTGIPLAHSQSLASSSSFSGSVSDSSGARVANANVTLSSAEKGITRTFKTDAEGSFSFSLLPAATYTLTVQATGFKTLKQEGITLEVGQSARQSVALTIGSTEQIEVTAVAPLLQTDNANVGDEIGTKQVAELPSEPSQCIQLCRVELVRQQWPAAADFARRGHARHLGSGCLIFQFWRRVLWHNRIPA